MFATGEDSHLIGRGLHYLRRSSVANMAGVRAAIATVTDDTNPARLREIHASLYGATAAAQLDGSHSADTRNERAGSKKASRVAPT